MSSNPPRTSNASSFIDEDAVSMLTALGFSADMATEALQVCGGNNVEAAANYLLSMDGDNSSAAEVVATAATASIPNGRDIQMIHGPISQYSMEQGRSACTCMALHAAEAFFKNSNSSRFSSSSSNQQQGQAAVGTKNPVQVIEASFLQNVVLSGVSTYQEMVGTLSSNASAMEHLSAEEVLSRGLFPSLELVGSIRQGLLSLNRNDEQGLKHTLSQCQAAAQDEWGCFLITKPPETVVVCLPSHANSTTNETATVTSQKQKDKCYVLIDTHPRPQLFHAENAYARVHASLDDLVTSLEAIFPATELGPDVPPLMAAMYNSFDVYGLALKI